MNAYHLPVYAMCNLCLFFILFFLCVSVELAKVYIIRIFQFQQVLTIPTKLFSGLHFSCVYNRASHIDLENTGL